MPIAITTEELSEEQQKGAELQTLLNSQTALTLEELRLDNGEKTIYCDVTDQIRIYVKSEYIFQLHYGESNS